MYSFSMSLVRNEQKQHLVSQMQRLHIKTRLYEKIKEIKEGPERDQRQQKTHTCQSAS